MAVYTLSDLHLAMSVDKPMDVFGNGWNNYMVRITQNWQATVKTHDTVIIGGDLSWAMYLNECFDDFDFIEKLNGTKIILKGNHDYWWESITKLKKYVEDNSFSSMFFLHNNSFVAENIGIFGTRGWLLPTQDNFKEDDLKIYERELVRLELSYNHLKNSCDIEKIIPLAVLHYPPVTRNAELDDGYKSFFNKHNIKHCIYGHLHGATAKSSFNGVADGVDFRLVSADFLEFTPYKLNF